MTTGATALVLEAPRTLVRRDLDLPAVGTDDALLRVEACGLCGTDHEQFTGTLPAPYPYVPGHETVGVIEAIGDQAAERWGVAAGDRVAVEVFRTCRDCDSCRAGEYRRCRHHGLRDMYGAVAVTVEPGLWGGYATHQYLAPDSIVHAVPAGLDPVVATLFNPLGAGIRWGVTVPATKAGDVVAVLGPGVRGLAAIIAARRAGAGFVLATGAGPRDAIRLERAASFGADVTVDVTRDDAVAVLRERAGRLADVVVDVTAKAPTALGQAVALARPGGTIVLAGTRGSADTPGFHPDAVVYKELHLVGALGVDGVAYRDALDLIAADPQPFADLPRRVAHITDADDVTDLLRTMAGEGAEPPVHAVLVP